MPARGVERWLTQRLSHRLGVGARGGDGVCAGVDFVTPHSLVSMLLDRDAEDPWSPDRLAWPLLEVIDGVHGHARLRGPHHPPRRRRPDRRPLRPALRRGPPAGGAVLLLRRPAPAAPHRVARGPRLRRRRRRPRRRPALAGGALAPTASTGVDVAAARRTPRRRRVGAAARRAATTSTCPPRLSLFGHTRLPETEVALLRALGELRDVHLWLPQASPVLWDALAPTARRRPGGARRRRLGRAWSAIRCSARSDATPASCAAPSACSPVPRARRPRRRPPTPCSAGSSTTCAPTPRPMPRRPVRARTAATSRCRCTPATARPVRSTCSGRCWSACSEDDPTLEPRDILVMCPDIETYAPLISAAFGMADVAVEGAGHPGHQLRVRLADRSLAATNPLLGVAAQLVELVRGRMTASQVLDVAGAEPVRARFGFGDDELERITHWVDVSRDPLGLRRRPPRHLRPRRARRQHLGRRATAGAAGRGDVRSRPPAGRRARSPSTT